MAVSQREGPVASRDRTGTGAQLEQAQRGALATAHKAAAHLCLKALIIYPTPAYTTTMTLAGQDS